MNEGMNDDYFNMLSKADGCHLNLPHRTKNQNRNKQLKTKMDMLIGCRGVGTEGGKEV